MEKNSYIPYDPKDWESVTRRNKVILSNPIFIKGLALAPVAVARNNIAKQPYTVPLCFSLADTYKNGNIFYNKKR